MSLRWGCKMRLVEEWRNDNLVITIKREKNPPTTREDQWKTASNCHSCDHWGLKFDRMTNILKGRWDWRRGVKRKKLIRTHRISDVREFSINLWEGLKGTECACFFFSANQSMIVYGEDYVRKLGGAKKMSPTYRTRTKRMRDVDDDTFYVPTCICVTRSDYRISPEYEGMSTTERTADTSLFS